MRNRAIAPLCFTVMGAIAFSLLKSIFGFDNFDAAIGSLLVSTVTFLILCVSVAVETHENKLDEADAAHINLIKTCASNNPNSQTGQLLEHYEAKGGLDKSKLERVRQLMAEERKTLSAL